MAFTSPILFSETIIVNKNEGTGRKRRVYGTFASESSSTGGAIPTGLSSVDNFQFAPEVNSITTNWKYAISGGEVTITTDADVTGSWVAVGDL